MGWTFPDNEISVDSLITYGAAWADVDLSTLVPVGTNFVILHIRSSGAYVVGTRPNGSTDDANAKATSGSPYHIYLFSPLDANRIFEGYFENAGLNVGIVGYTDSVESIINATDLTPGTTGSYQTVTAPVGSSNAAWVRLQNTAYTAAIRKGVGISTFDWYRLSQGGLGAVVGIDSNRQFEAEVADVNQIFYYGYSPSDIVMLTTPTDKTPTTSDWTTRSCLAESGSDNVGGVIIQIAHPITDYDDKVCQIRKNGSTDDFSANNTKVYRNRMLFAYCGVNGSKEFQVKTNVASDFPLFYLIGYIKSDAPPANMSRMFMVM